ncbi:MAG: hypothetical protein NZ922_05070 [Candidatus Methanomethyliaceae archaeon]|nr:hypothetical protein [Candidatus Methanomethyliaceae archaeon]MCX8169936.1 hypothetical protein [Candidatus Methanomethyliaceae archaeon]MDW7970736.1 hypothetical protein [Nitrososphaerota archaeon]
MEISDIINLVYHFFNTIRNFLSLIIEQTILRGRPDLAQQYSSALTIMITLTTLYLILVFISAARKAIGILIAIGWMLIIISITLKLFGL